MAANADLDAGRESFRRQANLVQRTGDTP